MEVMNREYTTAHFAFDLIMIALTGGLWLMWLSRDKSKR